MFLTAAELATLTGYRQKGRQLARLRQMGIPFWTNAAGQPVVARADTNTRSAIVPLLRNLLDVVLDPHPGGGGKRDERG